MKTRAIEFAQELDVWAIPRTQHEVDVEIEEGVEHPDPFKYSARVGNPWITGAVKVKSITVTIRVPGGIDLVQKAVETLREERKEALQECEKKCVELDQQINRLLQLEHMA